MAIALVCWCVSCVGIGFLGDLASACYYIKGLAGWGERLRWRSMFFFAGGCRSSTMRARVIINVAGDLPVLNVAVWRLQGTRVVPYARI